MGAMVCVVTFNLGHAEPLTGAEACDPLQAQAPALRPFAEGHS